MINILIALIIWLLQALAPAPADDRLTAYSGVLYAQPVIIATAANTLEFEAAAGENEAAAQQATITTNTGRYVEGERGAACDVWGHVELPGYPPEGCPQPPPPDVTCHAIGCTDPEPPFTRVPGRP